MLHFQLPSPRGLDTSGKPEWDKDKEAADTKEAKGWKAKALKNVAKKNFEGIIHAASALMEKPEGVQEMEGAMQLPNEKMPVHAGLDAHINSLYLTDAPEFYGKGEERRPQRYSTAVRERQLQRQDGKGKEAELS